MWVIFLEKAWAKVHGSYERIVAGQVHQTMRDLTGAPSYEYIIEDTPDLFEKVCNAESKNQIVCASTYCET